MAKRTVGRRPIRHQSAFIEPVFDKADVVNGTEHDILNGNGSPSGVERRRIKEARTAEREIQQVAQSSEEHHQRIAEDRELHVRGLDPLHGDIEGPQREADKQAVITNAEHKRLTGGRF